jgi:hypothetical protein
MKLESLVIGDQHAPVNTFPGLVHTARHTMGAGCSRSGCSNLREEACQGVIGDWGEVVTRYPYRKVGMDHLLSRSSNRSGFGQSGTHRSSPYVLFFSCDCPSGHHVFDHFVVRAQFSGSANLFSETSIVRTSFCSKAKKSEACIGCDPLFPSGTQ